MARIVLVGGGSSSGKSYVTKHVIEKIGEENICRLTIDDYYKDLTDVPMEARAKINYDHPKAFDWKLLRAQIQDLKNDKPIDKPVYDYVIHNRSDKVEHIVPKKIILVEGIMALVDKSLREMGDLKVFITASPEIRFLRRFIRDHSERKRTYESIVNQYMNTVAPMYDEIIAPSSTYADLIINNDGRANLAIDVLACVLNEELDRANGLAPVKVTPSNEFSEEILNSVFGGVEKIS